MILSRLLITINLYSLSSLSNSTCQIDIISLQIMPQNLIHLYTLLPYQMNLTCNLLAITSSTISYYYSSYLLILYPNDACSPWLNSDTGWLFNNVVSYNITGLFYFVLNDDITLFYLDIPLLLVGLLSWVLFYTDACNILLSY